MVVSCDKLIGVILLDMSSMHVSFLLSRFVKTSDSRFGLQSSDGVERTSRMGARSPCWYFSVLVVGWYFSATGVNCSLAGSNTSALLGWIFSATTYSELFFVYLFCFELTWGSAPFWGWTHLCNFLTTRETTTVLSFRRHQVCIIHLDILRCNWLLTFFFRDHFQTSCHRWHENFAPGCYRSTHLSPQVTGKQLCP